jgi:replicative DNA helicase
MLKEQTILGLVLTTPDQYPIIASEVNEFIFTTELNKSIWRAFSSLDRDNMAITTQNVLTLVTGADLEYLMECSSHVVFQNDIASALIDLENEAISSRLKEAVTEIEYNFKDRTGKDKLAAYTEVVDELSVLTVRKNTVEKVDVALNEILSTLNTGTVYGISTGYRDLDDIIHGFKNGSLYILGARPSHGKTALGLQLAWEVVKRQHKTLFISLEMTSKDLMKRIIAKEANVDLSMLVQNKTPTESLPRVGEVISQILEKPLRIYQKSNLYIEDLKNLLILEKRKHGLEFLCIDYIQLIRSRQRGLSRVEEIEKVSGELKSLSMQLDIPILCLAQLNRQTEMRNSTPRVSDLKGSGAIEQDADVVFLLQRDDLEPEKNTEYCKILIAKNRHGVISAIGSKFVGKSTHFVLN